MNTSPAADDAVLVDIGIPTYGRPEFLAEAIESVRRQTFASWSLTISENGPGSDFVEAIVEPHLSPRIHYIKTGSNLGAARNATGLIETGSAPFVAILNDDDRWDPGFLEQRIAFLEANPTCALVFSRCDFIDGTGHVLYRYEIDLPEGPQDRGGFLRTLYSRCVICMPTVVVRRSAYQEIGPYFKDSVLFYDHEMWLRIAARFSVGFLSACDAQYRVHESTTTQQRVRLHVGERKLEVLDEAEKILPSDFPRLERRRARFVALTRAGLDAFGRGERLLGIRWLARALWAHPTAPVDPEIASRVYHRLRQHAQDREFWSVGLAE